MAFLEKGAFCSIDEYRQYLPKRINESDMQVGDMHTVMFRLDGEYRAAKLPARINDIQEKGATLVSFAFLNARLEVQKVATATVTNGFLGKLSTEMSIRNTATGEKAIIEQAYCRDFFDEFYDHMVEHSAALSMK